MGRRLLLANVVLLVGIILLARYVADAWHQYDDKQNIKTVLAGAIRGRPAEVSVKAPPPPEPPRPYPDFTVIPEKDLFMPERRPPPPVTAEVKEVAPALPKKPSLNGVTTNAGKKQALLTIFEGNNPKGSTRVVSLGDDVQGYTVSEISDTTMKMRWKDVEILVDMFDSTPQQQAAAPAGRTSAAVTMITIGSAAAAVETVAASDNPADDRRGGIEVGVVGNQGGTAGQRGPGQGGRTGESNRGQMGGRGSSMGGSGTMGFPSGGSNSVPFNSGTRRPNVR
ncbi:MAG: hypothetical protein EHM61_05510 [Acidobacteria bacterium]|nr:MAG: hypothetical protein EHM61_05510 [Acidobacteriota bacterium]